MVYLYTTPILIQAELQSTTDFSATTTPSISDINEWIAEESAYINALSDTVYGSTSYLEYIDYDEEDFLFLEHSPVISITSVEYNVYPLGSTLGSSWVTKTAETHYSTYTDRGVIRILDQWAPEAGAKRIRVTYTAGYEVIPYEVRKLATKLVAERVLNTLIQKNVNERNDGGSVSVGSISIVEPSAYGLQSYNKLKQDIDKLKEELVSKQFRVHRLGHI